MKNETKIVLFAIWGIAFDFGQIPILWFLIKLPIKEYAIFLSWVSGFLLLLNTQWVIKEINKHKIIEKERI